MYCILERMIALLAWSLGCRRFRQSCKMGAEGTQGGSMSSRHRLGQCKTQIGTVDVRILSRMTDLPRNSRVQSCSLVPDLARSTLAMWCLGSQNRIDDCAQRRTCRRQCHTALLRCIRTATDRCLPRKAKDQCTGWKSESASCRMIARQCHSQEQLQRPRHCHSSNRNVAPSAALYRAALARQPERTHDTWANLECSSLQHGMHHPLMQAGALQSPRKPR